jgi:DNA-binding transcriptional ArsR family regulator
MENLIIRRRNRLRHHYTVTSNVLLFGYSGLSDGARLTYQVVDSFDWSDAAGLRKGFAHPSLGRLAKIRGVEKRSVRRHLAELEGVGLITREERPGRPSLLIIEDPSEKETEAYLHNFAGPGEDKIVLPTPDKIVRPYKKEEGEEKQKLVNEEQALSGVGESGRELKGPSVGRLRSPVPKAKREYLAAEMLSVLKDEHSLGFYRRVAEVVEPGHIFEALSIVKQISREGMVRKSRAALFATIVARDSMGSRDIEAPRVDADKTG